MEPQDDGLGGMIWECVAITLDQVRALVESFRKTRDENEKVLRKQLEDYLIPILEKQEESRKRKALQRERELLNMAKMANAKRSSRIAGKMEQQKQEEQEREQEREQRAAQEAARREERARVKMEQEREARTASREKRLKEREIRRLRHEEELAQLSDDSRRPEGENGRASERRLQAEIEKNRQALKDLDDEDEDWIFDCSCGLYGQVDDGGHSVACENCNVWQHSKCLGISEDDAEKPDFHFICQPCRKRKEEIKSAPRSPIRLKINGPSAAAAAGSRPTSSSGGTSEQPTAPASAPVASTTGPEDGSTSTGVSEVPECGPGASPQKKDAVSDSPTKGTTPSLLPKSPLVHLPGPMKQVSPLAHRTGQNDAAEWRAADVQHPHQPRHDATTLQGSPVKATNTETPRQTTQDVSKSQSATASLQASLQGHGTANTSIGRPQNSASSPVAPLLQTPAAASSSLVTAQSPALEPALSTPAIDRDIYRATYLENGKIPAQGGISPVKNSPHSSFTSATAGSAHNTPAKIPPGITLSPSPREPILTPPKKHSEPPRPPPPTQGQQQQ